MPGGGNRQLRVRLSEDHWVWTIQDAVTRRREVERALEFYASYKDREVERALEFYSAYRARLDELREWVEKIWQALQQGKVAVASSGQKPHELEGGDPRLFANMPAFLDDF